MYERLPLNKTSLLTLTTFISLILGCFMLPSCHKDKHKSSTQTDISEYRKHAKSQWRISSTLVHERLIALARRETRGNHIRDYIRNYYINKPETLLWVNRLGLTQSADSILAILRHADDYGINPAQYHISEIKENLARLQSLDFDERHTINDVLARIEYLMTRNVLSYVITQKYGYTDPYSLFNTIPTYAANDTIHKIYKRLYDIPTQRAGKTVFKNIIHKIRNKDIVDLVRTAKPESPEFYILLKRWKNPTTSPSEKRILLVNMERYRWRNLHNVRSNGKYIDINIPSLTLKAVAPDTTIRLKIIVGKSQTKTNLLTSSISAMELNPQWVIPTSILKEGTINHINDSSYMAHHRYDVIDRHSGKVVSCRKVNTEEVLAGKYYVRQRGGKGNALGRIIFRFKNSFSIYIHDTSSRNLFDNSNRTLSHGCIRTQNPLSLALFLIGEEGTQKAEDIAYSLTADIASDGNDTANGNTHGTTSGGRNKLLHRLAVSPGVPLIIDYHTAFVEKDGSVSFYPDIYGYDRLIYNQLQNSFIIQDKH